MRPKTLQRSVLCVSGRFKQLNETLGGRGPYRPEVNYGMSQEPPEPILDSGDDTKPHRWLHGWIAKYWGDPERIALASVVPSSVVPSIMVAQYRRSPCGSRVVSSINWKRPLYALSFDVTAVSA